MAAAVERADLCFACAPVGALPELVRAALDAAGPDCVVTDVGSTKQDLLAGVDDERFVGGHPIAGAETAGVEHARADMFQGAVWYLTPLPRSGGLLYERLHRFVVDVGARPVAVDPATHDRLVAVFSHLPHVLANVLASQAAGRLADHGEALRQVGPSFRDMTRVAGANTEIWTDIYRANRGAIAEEIGAFRRELERVEALLAEGDVAGWNERAREPTAARCSSPTWPAAPVHELRLTVPNRPGIVAQVALELGKAGVNIVDLALAPASDMRSGAMTLWIAGDDAGRARRRADRRAGLPRRGAVTAARFEPAAGPLRGDYLAARGQVDLPPRGAVRSDGRRAGDRAQLPRVAGHTLHARRAAEAGGGGGAGRRPRRGPDPRGGPARPAGGDRRPARRGQLRHADAPAAGLARRSARRGLDARRRRLDPAPAGRPDRRAADGDGRDGRGARRALPAVHRAAAPS